MRSSIRSTACPMRISRPIQPNSAQGAAPSSQRLPRQRCGDRSCPMRADRSAREAVDKIATEGKSLSVIPRPAVTIRAGWARDCGFNGRTQSRKRGRSAGSSGRKVISPCAGWRKVTVALASSSWLVIAINSGAFAPRAKFTHGFQPGSNCAASCATAQCRSHGKHAPAKRRTDARVSRPCPLIGWRQICASRPVISSCSCPRQPLAFWPRP